MMMMMMMMMMITTTARLKHMRIEQGVGKMMSSDKANYHACSFKI